MRSCSLLLNKSQLIVSRIIVKSFFSQTNTIRWSLCAGLLLTLPGQLKTLQRLSYPHRHSSLDFPQSLLPTCTQERDALEPTHTFPTIQPKPALLQVPFSHLTQSLPTCTSLLTQIHPAFISKAFWLERLYPCKSFVTVLHHAEMFHLSSRQNPCCSLSAICLVHSRAIFYLSAMITSKEVIPASSHLSFFQYKTEICEKARIVGKVSNVTALPEK